MMDDDPAFAALVARRRIAVVGPARTLVGRGSGPEIDRYDLIVRFNEAFEYLSVPDARAEDLGTRTDILYCNQTVLRTRVLAGGRTAHAQFAGFCERSGVRYVVCTNNSLSFTREGPAGPRCPAADRYVLRDFDRWLVRHCVGAQVRVVHAAADILIRWLGGPWPRTGFVGLFDLLSFDPVRVYATGMTLYHAGGHLLAPAHRALDPCGNRDGTSTLSPEGIGHDSHREGEVMQVLLRSFSRTLRVDDTLRQLLLHYDRRP